MCRLNAFLSDGRVRTCPLFKGVITCKSSRQPRWRDLPRHAIQDVVAEVAALALVLERQGSDRLAFHHPMYVLDTYSHHADQVKMSVLLAMTHPCRDVVGTAKHAKSL